MESLCLRTARLELLAATREILKAEKYVQNNFPSLLRATVPSKWPPPMNDETTMNWALQFLTAHPEAVGWSTWYFILLGPCGERLTIGNGGLKGKPTEDGTVEVGYSIVEEYQGNGYATEAIGKLIAWAFEHEEVNRVIAETFPHLRSSIRVLEKCGFAYIGEGSEMLIIRFELPREEFERLNPKR